MTQPTPSAWSLDRRITAALVLSCLLEIVSVVLWAGAINERVERLEGEVARHQAVSERLISVEVHMFHVRGQLDRIEARLERAVGAETGP